MRILINILYGLYDTYVCMYTRVKTFIVIAATLYIANTKYPLASSCS